MKDTDRAPDVVLTEMAPMLALLATRQLYHEQPELWGLGERGRLRVLEDFNHHFRALQSLNTSVFRSHVQYCETLFASRGFPQKWLDDAWRWMALVMERELPPAAMHAALAVLREAVEIQPTGTTRG